MIDDIRHLVEQLEVFVADHREYAKTLTHFATLKEYHLGKAAAYRLTAYWLRTDILKETIDLNTYLVE